MGNFVRNLLILAVVVVYVVVGWGIYDPSGDDWVTVDKIKQVVESRNEKKIVSFFKGFSGYSTGRGVYPFLIELWNLEMDKYPDLPRDIVGKDSIRVSIAKALIDESRIGHLDIEKESMRRYVKSLIHHRDLKLAGEALITLGEFNDKRDVEPIFKIARQQNTMTFAPAVYALSSICGDEAQKALESLKESATGPFYQRQLKIVMKNSKIYRMVGRC